MSLGVRETATFLCFIFASAIRYDTTKFCLLITARLTLSTKKLDEATHKKIGECGSLKKRQMSWMRCNYTFCFTQMRTEKMISERRWRYYFLKYVLISLLPNRISFFVLLVLPFLLQIKSFKWVCQLEFNTQLVKLCLANPPCFGVHLAFRCYFLQDLTFCAHNRGW